MFERCAGDEAKCQGRRAWKGRRRAAVGLPPSFRQKRCTFIGNESIFRTSLVLLLLLFGWPKQGRALHRKRVLTPVLYL